MGAYKPARALLPPSGHPAQAGWTSVGALASRAQPWVAWPAAPFRAVPPGDTAVMHSVSRGFRQSGSSFLFARTRCEAWLLDWIVSSRPCGVCQAVQGGQSSCVASRQPFLPGVSCLASCLQGDDRVSSSKRNSVQLLTRPRRGGSSGWRVICRERHGGVVLRAAPMAVLGRKVLVWIGRWMLD